MAGGQPVRAGGARDLDSSTPCCLGTLAPAVEPRQHAGGAHGLSARRDLGCTTEGMAEESQQRFANHLPRV
eukprot:12519606-Alexandrium_andersonii.AAC.1